MPAHKLADRKKRYDSDAYRERRLLRNYGITLQFYTSLLELQEGKCPICLKPLGGFEDTAVDHDHSTMEVRGLLHKRCNSGIGKMKDDPEVVRSLVRYLSSCAEIPVQLSLPGERVPDSRLARTFGVSDEGKKRWLDYLSNRCQSCSTEFKSNRDSHLDHNHKTGELRGLLCAGCNQGIGMLDENRESMLRAARYLEHPPGTSADFVLGGA